MRFGVRVHPEVSVAGANIIAPRQVPSQASPACADRCQVRGRAHPACGDRAACQHVAAYCRRSVSYLEISVRTAGCGSTCTVPATPTKRCSEPLMLDIPSTPRKCSKPASQVLRRPSTYLSGTESMRTSRGRLVRLCGQPPREELLHLRVRQGLAGGADPGRRAAQAQRLAHAAEQRVGLVHLGRRRGVGLPCAPGRRAV